MTLVKSEQDVPPGQTDDNILDEGPIAPMSAVPAIKHPSHAAVAYHRAVDRPTMADRPATEDIMDLRLSNSELDLQARACEFCEKHLYPYELELEENGKLPDERHAEIKQAILDYELNAFSTPEKFGGQGGNHVQTALVREELGKATGALWYMVWEPSVPLEHGTPEQIETFLIPTAKGERLEAYAVSEPNAGSDPSYVETTAMRSASGYVLNGEKWFVTVGDRADYLIVHAHVDGDAAKPTLFLVDKDMPGVRCTREPRFMHTFVYAHPEFVFENVELGEDRMLGGVGNGFELTKDWFCGARLTIGAHTVGAAIRAFEVANAYAEEREQFGQKINTFQGIEFMLADMATEIMAAKSMLYRVNWEIDAGLDRKLVHARASAVKLFCSEMAGRVVDKAVQILGGRGYMRENPVERLYRDVRVERIWEGSSEIQRVIIGGQIKKRGTGVYTGWS